jgi:hypothetical protein
MEKITRELILVDIHHQIRKATTKFRATAACSQGLQWGVMHSLERRLAWSMIDDEFIAYFELLLSVMLAKRRLYRVQVWAYLPVPYPGGACKELYTTVSSLDQ